MSRDGESRRMTGLRSRAERGSTEGERAAAQHAIDRHNEKLLTAKPVHDDKPGPDLTKRNGGAFTGYSFTGLVYVTVPTGEADARAWVKARRRMRVKVGGCIQAMIPTDIEADDDRGLVYVTAPADSLADR